MSYVGSTQNQVAQERQIGITFGFNETVESVEGLLETGEVPINGKL